MANDHGKDGINYDFGKLDNAGPGFSLISSKFCNNLVELFWGVGITSYIHFRVHDHK